MMVSKNPSSKLILVRSEERSVAPCDAGEQRARNLCVLLPHLSPLHLMTLSHKQKLFLKGESECKLYMNAVAVWMCTRKPS